MFGERWVTSFNSRPHKEVDSKPLGIGLGSTPFNSRPHKEVDCGQRRTHSGRSLSIHDLTRRSTILKVYSEITMRLSIHDLTRRSTYPESDSSQSESFQFTTSQGGRQCLLTHPSRLLDLSIHDLTRRSTCYTLKTCSRNHLSIHDLTRRSTHLLV